MLNELSITGTVQVIGERIDTGNFSKRDIVIRTDEQYPQDICVQFTQDKCDLLDLYKIGEQVTMAYNLRGKVGGWTNPQGQVKYFTTVQGWRIQRADGAQPQQSGAPVPAQPAPTVASSARKYIHTDPVHTEATYLATPGWTHDILVAQGKGRWESAAAPAPAPGISTDAYDQDLPF